MDREEGDYSLYQLCSWYHCTDMRFTGGKRYTKCQGKEGTLGIHVALSVREISNNSTRHTYNRNTCGFEVKWK